jgi:hypothetical protein
VKECETIEKVLNNKSIHLLRNNDDEVIDIEILNYDLIKDDIPFSENTPYVGMTVKVKYGQQVKITQITKILDEKPIKYRCAKCGSKKYLPSDFMEFNEEDKQFIEDMKEMR